MNLLKYSFPLVVALGLCSCAVGPNYQKPVVDTPPNWRWKKAEPKDADPKGEWWTVFGDAQLDGLIRQALARNQNLQAAVARVTEARAKARISGADLLPKLDLDAALSRSRTSANAPIPFPIKAPSVTQNSLSVPIDLSYEIDVWGRVRRSFESAQAQAQATAADYQNVLLTLTADVATDYFSLRAYDAEIAVLRHTLELRKQTEDLQAKKFQVGFISQLDLARATSERATAQSDLASVQRTRAETEASLAVLCGQPASSFQIAEQPLTAQPPEIPVGLPSQLLERRPDVAEAERTLAARNAEIGVAYAAFFPSISLTGQGGYLSADSSSLFSWESHVWSLGPTISLPLFAGGRNAADLKSARAAYDEALANYRQQVLVAFQDVEVSLSGIRFLKDEAEADAQAVAASGQAAFLAEEQYKKGTISYLDVIDAERELLQRQKDAALVQGQRLSATVRLIKALGGDWHS